MRARGAASGQPPNTIVRTSAGNASTPTVPSPGTAPAGSTGGVSAVQVNASTPISGAGGGGTTGAQTAPAPSPARRSGPAVVPAPAVQPLTPVQQPPVSQPNLMQKFTEMTAPGGDILSKGKELIFMKFGLGGK